MRSIGTATLYDISNTMSSKSEGFLTNNFVVFIPRALAHEPEDGRPTTDDRSTVLSNCLSSHIFINIPNVTEAVDTLREETND